MQPRNMEAGGSDATSFSNLGRSEARSTASSYSELGDALGRTSAPPAPSPPKKVRLNKRLLSPLKVQIF